MVMRAPTIWTTLALLVALLGHSAAARAAPLTAEVTSAQRAPLVGKTIATRVEGDETLTEVARRSGLGYLAVTRANPGVDPWRPGSGRKIVLPGATILPYPLLPGITINLAEFRLYFVSLDQERIRVRIYPVAIGSEEHQTPEGNFSVVNKIVAPNWTVPADIRRDRPGLPRVVPTGPDNPLGDFWIGLSRDGYGIHGTNEPYGVGRRTTHGCIRLYPEDIRDLFPLVKRGTPVRILYQPIKLGLQQGQLLAEVHDDFLGRLGGSLTEFLLQQRLLNWQGRLDMDRAQALCDDPRGIPVILSPFPSTPPRREDPKWTARRYD
ncbi:lipoprotein-anchoring transpeptidase ErfK/SrfK [Desulfuromonas soudanensis]|uniref:Lipoprotein-anchoring transpeptidase ErfK/SrfK n=1 Tax=Desulfuromonas soudanensis TaxID=1603606 RepID=A0A0M4D294_9BACT|nr:L,D-transpeptidase [Desulfuromonas soudanensis]ALC17352.1 lipoprotein-anchoring transpeptidase ErfK/SrfK [Desulfuromonas soudanensis]